MNGNLYFSCPGLAAEICLVFFFSHIRGPYISCYLFLGWLFDIGAGIRERVTTWWIGLLVFLIGMFCSLQYGGFIQKKESERSSGPVQLSKVLIFLIVPFYLFVLLNHFQIPFIMCTSSLVARRRKVVKGVLSLVKR
jgi:hypothetical protein